MLNSRILPALVSICVTRADWALTFEDNFDGAVLNTTTWNVRQNETHCEPCEPQLYLQSRLELSNGSLIIHTARDHVVGPGGQIFNYSSGWVDTSKNGFSQLYGRFAASIRLPPQNATGVWPAFWLMPIGNQCWPTGGEIDVFEYTANPIENAVFGTYRWGTSCGNDEQPLPGAAYPPTGAPAIDWSAAFHEFAVEWNATSMAFLVDNNIYEVVTPTGGRVWPTAAQYVILNTAIAWYWPPDSTAVYPVTMEVDWVKVWQWV